MADTMLQHYKVWVNLCIYTQTTWYIPIKSAIPQKGLLASYPDIFTPDFHQYLLKTNTF